MANLCTPYEIYTALGEEWWLQVYDAQYHEYGKNVFDQGLHGGHKEPGYLESAKKAYWFAAGYLKDEFLHKDLSVEFYTQIHERACSHFTGSQEDRTFIRAEEAGKLSRIASCYALFNLKMLYENEDILANIIKEDHEYSKCLSLLECFFQLDCLLKMHLSTNPEADQKEYDQIKIATDEWKKGFSDLTQGFFQFKSEKLKLLEIIDQRLIKINSCIQEKFSEKVSYFNPYPLDNNNPDLGIKASPLINSKFYIQEDDLICMHYTANDHPSKVRKLFSEFNEKIKQAKTVSEKVHWIADLYQALEWLHPFPDGQGRTDLILLGFLLSKYGANPAILKYPYLSTYSDLPKWESYLIEGMEKWQEIAKKQKTL